MWGQLYIHLGQFKVGLWEILGRWWKALVWSCGCLRQNLNKEQNSV